MRQLLRVLAIGVVILCGAAARGGDGTKPTAYDIAAASSASDVRLSPDGTKVLYLLTTRRHEKDAKPSNEDTLGGWKVERQVWLAPADGASEPRQLTFAKEKASEPAFLPDGSGVSFLRPVGGRTKLFVMRLDGGEPRPIDLGAYEPESYRWSSDGNAIAFTATAPETDGEKLLKWESGGATDVGNEWRNSRLYTCKATGGEVHPVTDGSRNIVEFDWSPDQSQFAVVQSESADPYHVSGLHATYVISATDGSIVRPLQTVSQQIAGICYSPDGNSIAFMTASRQTMSLMPVLMVFNPESKGGVNVVRGSDLTLVSCVWAGDSSAVIALAHQKTKSVLLRCKIGTDPLPLSDAGRFVDAGLSADRAGKRIAFLSSTPSDPVAPSVLDLEGGALARPVANVNPQIKDWTLGKMEVYRWKNPDGTEIEGVLTIPSRGSAPFPLMVFPHGGPDAVSSERFSGWTHYFAARGIAVLSPNYRGSFGYGADFYRANCGKLGEIVVPDIESGVDALIKEGRVDPEKLVYGGWSWGGYTTAWTIGQTTRYKAAVVGAGVVDVVAQYATSDINHGHAAQWEFGGNPWANPDKFGESVNPIAHIAKIKTPTLIIHGEKDQRVGYVNAQLLHRALLDQNVRTRFLSYPREPHGFTEPAHTMHMLQAWADWYAAQLAPAEH